MVAVCAVRGRDRAWCAGARAGARPRSPGCCFGAAAGTHLIPVVVFGIFPSGTSRRASPSDRRRHPAAPDRPGRRHHGARDRGGLARGARRVGGRPGLPAGPRGRGVSGLPGDARPDEDVRGRSSARTPRAALGMGDPADADRRGGGRERLRGRPGDDPEARLRGARPARARIGARHLAAAAGARPGDARVMGDGALAGRRRPLLQPPLPHVRAGDVRPPPALRVRRALRGHRGSRRSRAPCCGTPSPGPRAGAGTACAGRAPSCVGGPSRWRSPPRRRRAPRRPSSETASR